MAAVDPYAPQETRFRREFLIGASVLAIAFAVLLVGNPGIDLAISGAAKAACHVPPPFPGGPWCPTDAVAMARKIFMVIFAIVAVATLVMSVRIVLAKRKWLGFEQARCWFMIAVLLIGPGGVANLLLKDHMGRARPRDVIEFGGTKVFTPPLVPSSECSRNCSFISGEASSMFAPFFALALLLPQYRMAMLAAALGTGALVGAVRIVQGAHFMSDVLFAAVFMALTVSVLHIALIGLWREPRRTLAWMTAPFTPLLRAAAAAWVR